MGFDPFSMLASAVGGGLGFLVGGPMGAAVGSGLGTAAYTGDLGKGIASGLLSYGLGSAVEGLAGAAGGLGGGSGAAVDSLAGWGEAASPAASMFPHGASAVQGGAGALNEAVKSSTTAAPGLFDKLGAAAEGITKPGALYDVFGKNFMKTTLPIGLGAYSMFGDMGGGDGQTQQPPPYQSQYPFPGNKTTGRRYLGPGTPSPLGYEQTYFGYQAGGKVDPKRRGNLVEPSKTFKYDDQKFDPDKPGRGHARMDMYGDSIVDYNDMPTFNEKYDEYRSRNRNEQTYMAPSRRDQPGEMRFDGGGPVSGPGGGLDDAIPAIIDNRAPAKLSSGEYVVPAHAVSGLGDGSTEAGVAKLDAMVDGVMQHKFGTKNRKPKPISRMGGQGARPFAVGGLVPRSLLNVVEGRGTPMEVLQAYAFINGDSREPLRPSEAYPRGLATVPMRIDEVPEREDAIQSDEDNPDLDSARERISRIESGGNYGALGPMVGKDRAYGRYQVMGANIPSWTREALGREYTPEEYLADKKAQDAVFNHRFGGYMKKYGAKGASRAWFAGEGGMNNRGAKDALGTSVDNYERRFAG